MQLLCAKSLSIFKLRHNKNFVWVNFYLRFFWQASLEEERSQVVFNTDMGYLWIVVSSSFCPFYILGTN